VQTTLSKSDDTKGDFGAQLAQLPGPQAIKHFCSF
jgi:hypothetical protein